MGQSSTNSLIKFDKQPTESLRMLYYLFKEENKNAKRVKVSITIPAHSLSII